MAWIVRNFGGKARGVSRHREKWNKSYIWEVTRVSAVPILRAILPYLVLKKRQAELFLEFRETVPASRNSWGRHGLPPDIEARREKIMSEMKLLNGGKYDAVESFG